MPLKPEVDFCGKVVTSFFKYGRLQQYLNRPNSLLRAPAYQFVVRNGKSYATRWGQASFHTSLHLQENANAGNSTSLRHAEGEWILAAPVEKSSPVIGRLPPPIPTAINGVLKDRLSKLLPSAVPGRGIGEEESSLCAEEGCGNGGDGAAINHKARASQEGPAPGRQGPSLQGGQVWAPGALGLREGDVDLQDPDAPGTGQSSQLLEDQPRGRLVEDASAVRTQTPSRETRGSDAAGSTDEGGSKHLKPSSGSSDAHPHKSGRGRQQRPCEHEGCKVKCGNYAFPDGTGSRCKRHWLPGMTIILGGCKEPGCNTQANYNYPYSRGTVRCRAHKAPGMVNKTLPVCCSTGCTQPALYGREGDTSPSFCRDHKLEDMIDIHPRPKDRCHSPGCMSVGIYRHSSNKRQKFCKQHKGDGMVSWTNSLCEEKGCSRLAFYGWPGRGAWLLCPDHKKEGMVRRTDYCTFEGCYTVPTFGFPQDKTPSRCWAHMAEGMLNRRYKTCDVQDCEKTAYYGWPGERATRCGGHKDTKMVNVVKRLCVVSGCSTIAIYRVPGGPLTHCGHHKEENMVLKKAKVSDKRGAR